MEEAGVAERVRWPRWSRRQGGEDEEEGYSSPHYGGQAEEAKENPASLISPHRMSLRDGDSVLLYQLSHPIDGVRGNGNSESRTGRGKREELGELGKPGGYIPSLSGRDGGRRGLEDPIDEWARISGRSGRVKRECLSARPIYLEHL